MRKMSFADLMKEWQALLAAADTNEAQLAATAPQREALRSQLRLVQETKGTQRAARATAQVCTQRLKQQVEDGQMMAIQLRSAVRSLVDPRNEGLVGFGVAPLRKRSGQSREATLDNFQPATEPRSPAAQPAAPPPPSPPAISPDGAEPG